MTNNVSAAVLLVLVLGILLSVGIWSTAAAVDQQSTDQSITGENVTITEGWTELNASADRYHQETITIDDEVVEEGRDYFWNPDDGEIAFNNTRHPSGGEANASYTATELPDQTAAFVSVLDPIWEISAFLPLIAVVGAMFAGLTYLRNNRRGGAY